MTAVGGPANEDGMIMMMVLAVVAFPRLSYQVRHLRLMTSVTSLQGASLLPGEKNTTESSLAVRSLPAARLRLANMAALLPYVRTSQG